MVVAGAAMLVAMVLTALDATLRYVFNAPITFQQYLTENYLLVAMVNMAFAWGFRVGGYIRIDGVLLQLPSAMRLLILRTGLVASSAYVAVLAWTAFGTWRDAWRRGAVQFGEIDWPISWSWIWIPLGCGLLALRLFLVATGPAQGLQASHSGEDPV